MLDPAEQIEAPLTLPELIAESVSGSESRARAITNTPGYLEFVQNLSHPELITGRFLRLYQLIFDECLKLSSSFPAQFTKASFDHTVSLVNLIDKSSNPESAIKLLWPPRKSQCIPLREASDIISCLERIELLELVESKHWDIFGGLEKSYNLGARNRRTPTELNWLETESTKLVPENAGKVQKILSEIKKSSPESRAGIGQYNSDLFRDLLKSDRLPLVLEHVDNFVLALKAAGRQGFRALLNSPNLPMILEGGAVHLTAVSRVVGHERLKNWIDAPNLQEVFDRRKEVLAVAKKLGFESFGVFVHSREFAFVLDHPAQISKAAEKNTGKDVIRNLEVAPPEKKIDVLNLMATYKMQVPAVLKKALNRGQAANADVSVPAIERW